MMPASLSPGARKAIGGLQAAVDDAAHKTVPPTKFGADALNALLDSLNSGTSLFGAKARAIPLATKPGTIPVEAMKFLLMLDAVAADLGREAITDELDDARQDPDLVLFAGMVEAFLSDPEVRMHLKSPAPIDGGTEPVPMPEREAPMPNAPESSPRDRLKSMMLNRPSQR